jgi:proteasome lid subunit RPN8/RPN11
MQFFPINRPETQLRRRSEMSVVVLSTESLYPDPPASRIEEFAESSSFRLQFGARGPILAVAARALEAATWHVSADLTVESGGVCLGRVFRGPNQRLLISLEEIVRAENSKDGAVVQEAASLTFTPQAWRSMIDICQRNFSSLRILGWYHSHPGFGVFLSSMDLFIHNHFFSEPWHLALVIDPRRRHAGFFVRHQKKLLLNGLQWKESTAQAVPLQFTDLIRATRITRLCQSLP